jgi:GNAT superfamily N-acetyltransferase
MSSLDLHRQKVKLMKNTHQMEYHEVVAEEEDSLLFNKLNDGAVQAGMQPIRSFGIFVKDPSGKICAGVKSFIFYGCLYTDMLWVEKDLRAHGWGSKLMKEAEEKGKQSGCTFAAVNTMSWEALPFYQKLGYSIEFSREGYAKGVKDHFLRKKL